MAAADEPTDTRTAPPPSEAPPGPSRSDVHRMFDRIAPTYDRANRIMALGSDRGWRRRLARHLPPGPGLRILDLATGTADQIVALFEARVPIREAIGIDLAEDMMALGRRKLADLGLADRARLETGDALHPPFPESSFDAVTMSFGIRNMVSVPDTLQGMLRVLRPGGRAIILECSRPGNPLVRWGHRQYLRWVVGPVGGWISGDREAYRYLHVTAASFPSGRAFLDLMTAAGFADVRSERLMGGAATIYVGERGPAP